MNEYAIVYINGFAITILILVLSNYRQKFEHMSRDERAFFLLILSTIASLFIGAVIKNLWMIDGIGIHITLYILQTIDFILSIFIGMLWLYYCIFRIYIDIDKKLLLKYIIPLPSVFFILFIIASSGNGLIFSVSERNVYNRGSSFMVSIVIGYIYIISSLVLVIAKRKYLGKGELFPYLLIPLIPMILQLIEIYVKVPVSITWPATSIVLLVIQIYILNSKTNTDHLTGLNNRMSLDSYIKRLITESRNSRKSFGIIMLDLDGFKQINDLYGHNEGDQALKTAADILSACCAGRFFISRYGGDEFTVVIKDCTHEFLKKILLKIEESRLKYNKMINKPYELVFSIGSSIFGHQEITDIHSIFVQVDNLMYKNKNAKYDKK